MKDPVKAFLRKEITEISRDRRTLFLAFLLPVVIYPAIFSFMSKLERQAGEKLAERVIPVAVTGQGADPIRAAVRADSSFQLVAGAEPTDLRRRLEDGSVLAWVEAPAIEPDQQAEIQLHYHSLHEGSKEARRRLEDLLHRLGDQERQSRWTAAGGKGRLDHVLEISEGDVATEQESSGARAGRLIPYILIMTLFVGGASLSTDIVAGEKERGTLETLYLTPVDRGDIAFAKYLIVASGTALTGLLSLGSMVFSYRMGFIAMEDQTLPLDLSTRGVLTAVLLVLPLAALVGGILLAISARARSLKEAQYFMMPIMILSFVPGMLATSQALELTPLTALLPFANVALAVRDVLIGPVPLLPLALVSATSVGWGFLVQRWVGHLLSREDMILGFDPEPLLAKSASGRLRAAHLGMAGTLLVYFYVADLVQARYLMKGLAVSLWVLLPLLALMTLRLGWSGGRLRDVLSLRAPHPASLVGAVLLGVGVILPIIKGLVSLQGLVFPHPESWAQQFDVFLEGTSTGTLFFLIAVSPAICEELTFRGVFLGLLRRSGGARMAVVVSAVYFALLHLSVFRFLPTFLLGLIMGTIVLITGSIFPSMIFHLVYNGTIILGPELVSKPPFAWDGWIGWTGSVLFLAAGAKLVAAGRRQARE